VSASGQKSVDVMARWKYVAVFVAGALVGALSAVEVVPNFTGVAGETPEGEVLTDDGLVDGAQDTTVAQTGSAGTRGESVNDPGTPTAAGAPLPSSRPGLECAPGKNGGSTDRGVTGSEIEMATTVAESGIGAAFLGEVRFAMEAVRNKINRSGGVCGRSLSIEYRDDGWEAQRGAQYLRNFMQQGIFAIPVCPSSEGCRVVIESGDLDRTQTPLVGGDGLLKSQYERADGSAQPWVWPVAAATVSSARIMCHEAYKRGARGFSIVFDRNYRFGVEAAEAFNSCVKGLTGKDIPGYNRQYNCDERFCGILAGQQSYSTDVARFEPGDFVALFLEPDTAQKWMADPNTPAASRVKFGYGGAQPLFTRSFATNCGGKCDQMRVWTGFKPPVELYRDDPAVRRYVEDLKREKPDADEFNAFSEGGYVGMQLLVDALSRVGPELSRVRLKQALDSTCLATGLTIQPKICFSPSNRYANITMQAFTIQYRGTFAGWRAGPIVKDTGA
jgi:ABC-type branched-subunit amino acid transport system substrate-binding protein